MSQKHKISNFSHKLENFQFVQSTEISKKNSKKSKSNLFERMSYLPFKVHWTDGGGHDSSHKVTHLLDNNSDTYCSAKKDNVSVVFEESRGRRFRLSRIDLRTAGDGYTAPCKDVMVFVCDKAPDMIKYKKFDSYTKEQFEDELDEEPLLERLNSCRSNSLRTTNRWMRARMRIRKLYWM